jgi:hypothetical protein
MRQQLRLRVLVPIAVLALLGVGAGAYAFTGTPDEEPLPTPPPAAAAPAGGKKQAPPPGPKLADWAKQANDVCTGLVASVAEVSEPQKPESVAAELPQTLALAQSALVRLKALPPPRAEAAQIAQMLAALETFLKLEQQASQALTNQDIPQYVNLNAKAFDANDKGSAIARRLGAKACALGDSSDSALGRQLQRHNVVVAVLYTPDAALDSMLVQEARAGANEVHAGFVAVNVTDTRSSALLAKNFDIRSAPVVLVFVKGEGLVTTFDGLVDRDTVAQAAENAAL